MEWRRLVLASFLAIVFLSHSALADQPAPPADPNEAVWRAASDALERGPKTIEIKDQASLALPEGYGFLPREHAVKVMALMGNSSDERLLGLIYPLRENTEWFVTVEYEESGYIKDEEAKHWDADGLLDNLKEGTEEGNKRREKMGIDPIKVTRWVEPPAYDASLHHLVWSAELRRKNGEDPNPGVNYNTYVLGREGFISMCLVTSLSTVESEKPAARELLSAVSFHSGKRYEDFNSSTDKVAAYGLAALVGGAVAKKIGLLGVFAAFFAKFAKVIFVGGAALGAGLFKRFKSKGSPSA